MSVADLLIKTLPLKQMEGALLTRAVILESQDAELRIDAIREAIVLASYLHRSDTRAQRAGMPRVPYIEHPLRIAARLLRYGCCSESVVISALLHDTVEDHADSIALEFAGDVPGDEAEARTIALDYLGAVFGRGVSRTVAGLTNPIMDPSLRRAEKNAIYQAHVVSAIADSDVFLVKVSDFVDNAVGLRHNLSEENAGMVRRLATKYLPLVPVFQARAAQSDIRPHLTADGLAKLNQQLVSGEASLRLLATV